MPIRILDEYVTVAKLAEQEGVSVATGHNWVARGLPVFRVFGKTLVHLPTAREWMLAKIKSKNSPSFRKKAA